MISRRTFLQTCSGLLFTKNYKWADIADFSIHKFRMLPKSLWVWSSDQTDLNEVKDFSLKNGFNPIFISFPMNLDAKKVEYIRAKINIMKEAGLTIYLAGGDPQWITLPSNNNHHEFLVRQALMINASGIALDIEPQAKQNWSNPISRKLLAENYYAIIQQINELAKIKNLPLIITSIPEYQYIILRDNERLIYSLGNIAQAEVLMSYHKSTIEALNLARPAIKQLELSKTPYWFGMNVPEPNQQNPHELISMISSSSFINSQLNSSKMFLGIAFNDYNKIKCFLADVKN
jgi:hypothetical protein